MSERTSTDDKAHRTAPWPDRHRTGRRTRLLLIGIFLLMISMALVTFSGCFRLRSSAGGGQTSFTPPRVIRAADVALPAGYRIEPVGGNMPS
jgi:hypothetical protein